MLVNVCKKDVNDGEKWDSTTCMVALAIRRKLRANHKNVKCVEVDSQTITVGKKTFDVSEALSNKINDFDDGVEITPFKFNLDSKTLKATVA